MLADKRKSPGRCGYIDQGVHGGLHHEDTFSIPYPNPLCKGVACNAGAGA